jgi:toxic protein SymE
MADTDLKSLSHVSARSLACETAYIPVRQGTTTVPRMRLKGKWLEDAGFEPNSRVCILMQHRQLIITPLPDMP